MKFKQQLLRLHYVQAIIVAVAFSTFFMLIAPLQTYLGNRGLFDFTPLELLSEIVPLTLVVFVVLLSVLLITELFLGRFLLVVAVAILACGYLESGIFSIGLPPLNGELVAFKNPFRSLFDTCLLCVIFVPLVACYKWTKGIIHWVALAIFLLSSASLFDVRSDEAGSPISGFSEGICPRLDVAESLRFSPYRNVILIILDSTPATIASQVVKENPEIQEHFPGFVAYNNNLAMHEMTIRGLPGLMTGKYLTPEMSANDYVLTMFGPDSLLIPYAEANDPIYFSGGLLSYCYTNRRLGDFTKISESLTKSGSVLNRNSSAVPYISLAEVVKFRVVPYMFKMRVLCDAFYAATREMFKRDCSSEDFLFPLVASKPLQGEEGKTTLSILHTKGIHGPITRDRHGKLLPSATQEVAAHYEYGVYLMRKVGELMDELRKKGVYDNSLIVVAADHGLIVLRKGGLEAEGSDGHGAESSILWVKPIGASGDFSFSSIPTSNCRIADLIKQSECKNLSRREIDEILFAKERRFYAKHGEKWWTFGRRLFYYEWVYDENGNLMSYENKGIYKAN